jgi:hypothetical protein
VCTNASFAEIFDLASRGTLPVSDVTLVIQTKSPYRKLFDLLFEWLIQTDWIGRIEIKPLIESFGSSTDSPWPALQRERLEGIICDLSRRPFEATTPSLRLDFRPFAPFEWTNDMDVRPEIQLARAALATLVKLIRPPEFVQLLAALLTEQPIVVLGRSVGNVSESVLAMHLMLHPLVWQCPSTSLLAPHMFEVLDSPSSYLYGITSPGAPIPSTTVVVDLADGSVRAPPLPPLPTAAELIATLDTHWSNIAANEEEAVYLILEAIETVIKELLYDVDRAIVANYNPVDVRGSTFVPELWFAMFKLPERPFAVAMSQTQLIQFYIQLKCAKRSEAFAVPR